MPVENLRYELSIPDVAGRHYEVALSLDTGGAPSLSLRMPAWVPGSYCIREFAGHVTWLTAQGPDGPVFAEKTDKATWRLDTQNVARLLVRYEVYAPELSVRTNDISHDHAFVQPGATFLAVVGHEDQPSVLVVHPPEGWQVATALDPLEGEAHAYRVPDYHVLVDSPLELGPHEVHEFEVADVLHQLVIHGEGNYDAPRLLRDVEAICRYEVSLFGEMPCSRYLFILLLTEGKGGGLEHAHGSVLAWPQLKFRPDLEYRKFLTLVAHEYFHTWNVKRIKPAVLLELDYSREIYTRLLWVFEGITSYYDTLAPLRAKVFKAKEYLELLAEHVTVESSRSGRRTQSMADSSFDTWIKLYRPTPDSYNSQISYYEKGHLVALMLDLQLRQRTEGRRSLDDVMRHLYRELYRKGKGLEEDGFGPAVEAATGVDMSEFLRVHVEQPGRIDLGETLAAVGLAIEDKPREEHDEGVWLGANFESRPTGALLTHVAKDGPAHRGGLMSGDELVALDGFRVGGDLETRVKRYKPGEIARWSVFRRNRLVEGTVVFAPHRHPPQRIVPRRDATDAQRARFEQWTGVAWSDAFTAEDFQKPRG